MIRRWIVCVLLPLVLFIAEVSTQHTISVPKDGFQPDFGPRQTGVRQKGEKKYSVKQLKYFEKKGERFLDEVAKRNDVVFMNGGLMVHFYKRAEEPARSPGAMDLVELSYDGYFINGTKFDSSEKVKDGKISLRPKHVIECWTAALQMMSEGDRWRVWCPWNLAYGAVGMVSQNVLPYSELYYDIEMLKVVPPPCKEDELPGKPLALALKLFTDMKAPDQTPLPADFKRKYDDDKKDTKDEGTKEDKETSEGEKEEL